MGNSWGHPVKLIPEFPSRVLLDKSKTLNGQRGNERLEFGLSVLEHVGLDYLGRGSETITTLEKSPTGPTTRFEKASQKLQLEGFSKKSHSESQISEPWSERALGMVG
jgi:hypothetical protein